MSRFKSFFLYIIADHPNLILENRVFNLTIFLGAVLIFVVAVSNLYIGMDIVGVIIPFITGFILFGLYYLSRFRQKFLLSSVVAIPILYFLSGSMWFLNAGQSGSMIHALQLFFLFFFAVLPRKYHLTFSIFHVIFLSTLYILEYYHPEWLFLYKTREAQTFDQIITMTFVMVCVYAIMMSIKAIYEERNKEVNQQKENLELLNSMKDKMLSVISHDIRSPLTQIKGVLSLINEGIIGQEKSEYLFKELYKNVHETQDLLDTLVTWASFQLKEGGISLKKENIDLKQTLVEAIALFSSHLKDKNLQIVCTVSREMYIFSDPNILLLHLKVGFE